MRIADQDILSVADAFNSAAFSGNWLHALDAMSRATGSRVGQLVGLGSANSVHFNWITELETNHFEEFRALDGGNPEINPIVRAGKKVKPLTIVSSGEFLTREVRRNNSFIAELSDRHDLHHLCLTPLIKEEDLTIGLAVIRSKSQGEIESEQRAAFAAIAPHARSAVRNQIALESYGAEVIGGALESLSLPAFICDRQRRVLAMTPSAELILSEGKLLTLKSNYLACMRNNETRALTSAILKSTSEYAKLLIPASSTVIVHNRLAQASVVQVLALPRAEFTFGFEPRALVIVRGTQPDTSCAKLLLNTAYNLTAAESDVAIRLVGGLSPEGIATERKVSIGTVRVQIRSIYEKLGVNRFGELAARVNQLR